MKMYEQWKIELIQKPRLELLQDQHGNLDHPLSRSNESTWKKFYDDRLLWEEIEKDVKRTRVELGFFSMAVDKSRNSKEDLERLEMQAHTKKNDLSQDDV